MLKFRPCLFIDLRKKMRSTNATQTLKLEKIMRKKSRRAQKGLIINLLLGVISLFVGLMAFLAVATTIFEGIRFASKQTQIAISSPMILETDKESGYKKFDVEKHGDFASPSFFSAVKSDPFVVAGGYFYSYLRFSGSEFETADENIKRYTFSKEYLNAYGPESCIRTLSEKNRKIWKRLYEIKAISNVDPRSAELATNADFAPIYAKELDLSQFVTEECEKNTKNFLQFTNSLSKCVVSFGAAGECIKEKRIYTANLVFYSNASSSAVNGVEYARQTELEKIKFGNPSIESSKSEHLSIDNEIRMTTSVKIQTPPLEYLCANIYIEIEKLLCMNRDLAGKLEEVESIYTALRHSLSVPSNFFQEHDAWRSQYRRCENISCLEASIESRFVYLQSIR